MDGLELSIRVVGDGGVPANVAATEAALVRLKSGTVASGGAMDTGTGAASHAAHERARVPRRTERRADRRRRVHRQLPGQRRRHVMLAEAAAIAAQHVHRLADGIERLARLPVAPSNARLAAEIRDGQHPRADRGAQAGTGPEPVSGLPTSAEHWLPFPLDPGVARLITGEYLRRALVSRRADLRRQRDGWPALEEASRRVRETIWHLVAVTREHFPVAATPAGPVELRNADDVADLASDPTVPLDELRPLFDLLACQLPEAPVIVHVSDGSDGRRRVRIAQPT